MHRDGDRIMDAVISAANAKRIFQNLTGIRVSRSSFYRWMQEGAISVDDEEINLEIVKVGKHWFIPWERWNHIISLVTSIRRSSARRGGKRNE